MLTTADRTVTVGGRDHFQRTIPVYDCGGGGSGTVPGTILLQHTRELAVGIPVDHDQVEIFITLDTLGTSGSKQAGVLITQIIRGDTDPVTPVTHRFFRAVTFDKLLLPVGGSRRGTGTTAVFLHRRRAGRHQLIPMVCFDGRLDDLAGR
uniref:(northern house mosquito) hypothetical protein n=1 Tax=Culex pipiens TaxID=7175 RepID=A0A8D8HX25_CULPI